MAKQWHKVEDQLPKEGVEVLTMSENGLKQSLWRFGRLWYTDADAGMYVYYRATHWRELD